MNARALARAGMLALSALIPSAALRAAPVTTVGDLLGAVRALPPAARSYFVISVAGHVVGYGGTDFRTDVTMASLGGSTRVAVAWLAQGTDNSDRPLDFFDIGASPASFPDLVDATLGFDGIGALVVAAVDANGGVDENGVLTGFGRVWSTVNGCGGQSSIAVPGVRFRSEYVPPRGLLLDESHRGTLGLVNPDVVEHRWTAHVAGAGTVTVAVPPASMRQVALPGGELGYASVDVASDSDLTYCGYAVSIGELATDGVLLTLVSQ